MIRVTNNFILSILHPKTNQNEFPMNLHPSFVQKQQTQIQNNNNMSLYGNQQEEKFLFN